VQMRRVKNLDVKSSMLEFKFNIII
jgi:hypothetical protein